MPNKRSERHGVADGVSLYHITQDYDIQIVLENLAPKFVIKGLYFGESPYFEIPANHILQHCSGFGTEPPL